MKLWWILLLSIFATMIYLILIGISLKNGYSHIKIESIHPFFAGPRKVDEISIPICPEIQRFNGYSIEVDGQIIRFNGTVTSPSDFVNVFVVLHSHVDPGWLQTFNGYYYEKVQKIIDNVVKYLAIYPELKFIWSEISFLEKWWSESQPAARAKMLQLIKEGRLEITTGSWVMTDEATPYFWSSIDNMIIGHQYLQQVLNITVDTAWSVDPFGHSLMMPYLLSLSNVNKMVINRISYIIKDQMKRISQLRFRWVQSWDKKGTWAPFVTVLPRSFYTTVDACGPNPAVCCMFDVAPTARTMCTERATADANTLEKFATLMADQYRKLQPYYNSKSLLVAAGDDFLFAGETDLSMVYRVYSALFEYINKHKDYKMKVQFGTVKDYFDSLDDIEKLPPLKGDFFPYIDQPNSFWTGFYVHRPFHKRLERIMLGKVRSVDILSLIAKTRPDSAFEIARRDFALFQHHDAITGTSKPRVVKDYTTRLANALTETLLQQLKFTQMLSGEDDYLRTIDVRISENSSEIILQNSINFSSGIERVFLRIFSQNSFDYSSVITLTVNTPNIEVQHRGTAILAQIGPVFDRLKLSTSLYTLSFRMKLKAFDFTEIELQSASTLPKSTVLSTISTKSIQTSTFPTDEDITMARLENEYFGLIYFPMNDDLKNTFMWKNDKITYNFDLNFIRFKDSGGAYVMHMDSAGKVLCKSDSLATFIVKGPIITTIRQTLSDTITYSLSTVHETDDDLNSISLRLDVWSDLTRETDANFLASLKLPIDSEYFFTDANGMQLQKRRYDPNVKSDGNFYPMPTACIVQDDRFRITALSGQPTGVTWLDSVMCILVDRKLATDDGKGLSIGDANESLPTHSTYRIIVEKKLEVSTEEELHYHSPVVHQKLEELLFPFYISYTEKQGKFLRRENFLNELPCNIQLINMRFITQNEFLVIMRRLPFDCSVKWSKICNNNSNSIYDFLKSFGDEIYESNLTGTTIGSRLTRQMILNSFMRPFHIVTFKIVISK